MLEFLLKLTRWREWGYSKIPLLFAAGNVWLLLQPSPDARALGKMAAWILFSTTYLAFGYSLNDFYDRNADRLAGKSNALNELGTGAGAVWLIVLIGLGITILIPFYQESWIVPLVATSYALATAYSMPPLRFKERGVAGLLVSSVAQRSMPLLVGMALFGQFGWSNWLLVLLFTLIGIRWILLHQMIDLPKDEISGVSTFTRAHGVEQALRLLKNVVFPIEVVCLLAWLVLASIESPVLLLMAPVYGIWLSVNILFWKGRGPSLNWTTYWRHPLRDFYEIFWPLFLGVILAVREPVYIPLLLFQIAWQTPYLIGQLPLGPRSKTA